MLIWLLLFLVIVGVSFVLALRSMGDYQEKPLASAYLYTLFLVGKPEKLTPEFLDKIFAAALQERGILSFERLFKGPKRALVIFGPASVLNRFANDLKLTELEDYSKDSLDEASAWEIGQKPTGLNLKDFNLLLEVPKPGEGEEFWWQVVLQPQKDKELLTNVVIRTVFKAPHKERASQVESELLKIGEGSGLALLPQAYSSSQIIEQYRARSMPVASLAEKGVVLNLTAGQVRSLLGL